MVDELRLVMPDRVAIDVDLSAISRWKIGGIAKCLVFPRSVDEVSAAIGILSRFETSYVVFGHTSNLLFSDAGLAAVGMQISDGLSDIRISDNLVICGAGAWVPKVARVCGSVGLHGIEHTCGIPGTIGGLTVMNGGSLRRSIGDHIVKVTSVDQDGCVIERASSECDFSYRNPYINPDTKRSFECN